MADNKKIRCANCGKIVEEVCAVCWRCKDCVFECAEHMKRTKDGHNKKIL